MALLDQLAAELAISPRTLAGRLLSSPQANEQAEANYLTINAQGQVGALFTGGVQLNEYVGSSPLYSPANTIAWLNPGMRSFIQGYDFSGLHTLLLVSQPDANNNASIGAQATEAGGTGTAGVVASAQNTSGSDIVKTIITSAGASDFVFSRANVGFFNKTPIAQRQLSTGAGHTVDDVITALQAYGLVRQ